METFFILLTAKILRIRSGDLLVLRSNSPNKTALMIRRVISIMQKHLKIKVVAIVLKPEEDIENIPKERLGNVIQQLNKHLSENTK